MNLKIPLFTKFKNTYSAKKLLHSVIVFVTLYSYTIVGQVQKLDSRFDFLLNNKKITQKGGAIKEFERSDMKLDKHLVVTSKGAQTMYSCIIYTKTPEKLKKDGILVQSQLPNFATALVSIEDIENLLQLPYVNSIMAPKFIELQNDVSRAQSGASLLQDGVFNNTAYDGTGVLVGIYDTGIDWKHPDFRKEDDQTKSRIVSIWDQSLTTVGTEVPPTGFSTGVEYTRAQIEDELDGSPANFVRQNDTGGHGSHVAGTAAGNGMGIADKRHKGFAPNADIVVVKGGNGSFADANIINGLSYFKNVATALNKPIVVNMSLGGQASAHDGTEATEVAVNDFVNSGPGRVVVIAAGNDHGTNLHRQIELEPTAKGTYTFTVADNTNETSAFNFILFSNTSDEVIARLTTPDGQQYTQNTSSRTTHSITNGGLNATITNYQYQNNGKRFIQLELTRPTGSETSYQGTYTLEIENIGNQPSTFHGWLFSKRVNTTLGDGDNEYIVGSPGNASDAITVASYMGRASWYGSDGYHRTETPQESISSFSNQGPRTDGFGKPDITASGQNVISVKSSDFHTANSEIINGTDYYVKMQGTSMSSPGVAGAVAQLLQAKPNLTADEVKTRLLLNARQDAATGEIPNARWGFGKLDIYKAITEELGCVKSNFEIVTHDSPFIAANYEGDVTFSGIAFAVRYTPTLTGKLGAVSFATGPTNSDTPSEMPVIIQIRKVDANGNPGDIIGTKTLASWVQNIQKFTWNYIDVSDLNIQAVTEKDFYIVINGLDGNVSIKTDTTNISGRSKLSQNGTTWIQISRNLKIRATVYEDIAEVKNLATSNQTKASEVTNGYNYFTNECQLISRVEKETESTVAGNVTSKVWTDNIQPDYVSRRFQINPETNATTASGKVTLYFKQAEFDAYNLTNTVKLPTSPTDDTNKQNLIVEKYSGVSAGNIGTVASYGSTPTTITPNAADIVWNNTYQYWEVSFQTAGFGGYFVKTNPLSLGTLNPNATDSGVNIYPNPAKEIVNINIGKAIHAIVTIYDASGKLVKTQNINTRESKIDVSGFTKGTYLFNITLDKDKKVIKKIIKE